MFCHKCGKELVEGSKFCNGCGNEVVEDKVTAAAVTRGNTDDSNQNKGTYKEPDETNTVAKYEETMDADDEGKNFVFKHSTSFGRAIIKEKGTAINLAGQKMTYGTQSVRFLFVKSQYVENEIDLHQVTHIRVEGIIDASDFIFAFIFAILGTAYPPLFLMTALLIWSGIGKRMTIKTSLGNINVKMNGIGYKKKLNNFINEISRLKPSIIKQF